MNLHEIYYWLSKIGIKQFLFYKKGFWFTVRLKLKKKIHKKGLQNAKVVI